MGLDDKIENAAEIEVLWHTEKHLTGAGKEPVERHVGLLGDLDQHFRRGHASVKVIANGCMRHTDAACDV